MLRALYALADEGLDFRVALAGENFRVRPAEFVEAQARLGRRLIHFGYAASQADYVRLLWQADIVLSTAIHEFFGVGVVEALYCGCAPVLPNRLSYRELLPVELHAACLYDDFGGLLARLRRFITQPAQRPAARAAAARFDWGAQAPIYDALVAQVAGGAPVSPGCEGG
jgi:glycosyltransferase involved in cell wall biosynthesis